MGSLPSALQDFPTDGPDSVVLKPGQCVIVVSFPLIQADEFGDLWVDNLYIKALPEPALTYSIINKRLQPEDFDSYYIDYEGHVEGFVGLWITRTVFQSDFPWPVENHDRRGTSVAAVRAGTSKLFMQGMLSLNILIHTLRVALRCQAQQ